MCDGDASLSLRKGRLQQHTVRGLFAGLKKRHGIAVEVLERVRQVGPDKQAAKGSYSIYRVAAAR